MAHVTFDMHRYIARLKQGGVPEEQADAFASQAKALAAATKDLVSRDCLDAKLAELHVENQQIRGEMHAMKADLINGWLAF
jgi:hypothetical protein